VRLTVRVKVEHGIGVAAIPGGDKAGRIREEIAEGIERKKRPIVQDFRRASRARALALAEYIYIYI